MREMDKPMLFLPKNLGSTCSASFLELCCWTLVSEYVQNVENIIAMESDITVTFAAKINIIMQKIYHLATCSTCQRILKELPAEQFQLQDIKTENITPAQIEEMHKLAGSYEALFSRRAMKYRSMGLNEMDLNEEDYKKYILEEYTFLKRPVAIIGEQIFIGNSKKTVAQIQEALQ